MPDDVAIVEYDRRWPARFTAEADRVRRAIDEPFVHIEHHGSTAVPGLAAKPVIDLVGAVPSIGVAERYAAALVRRGYETVEPCYREIWLERIMLTRREDGRRVCHVHLVLGHHDVWVRLLAFRDYLRSHPDVAAEYAALKRTLAASLGQDRHAYMTAKGEFIDRITAIAMTRGGGP